MSSRISDEECVVRNPYGRPTPKQLEYAKELGIEVPADATRSELSEMISETKNSRPPTEKQLELAEKLGIDSSGKTRRELSLKIDVVLHERGLEAVRQNPSLRAGKSIIRDGEVYKIYYIGSRRYGGSKRYVADLRPEFPGRGKAITVQVSNIADAEEVTVVRRGVN